MTCASPQSSSPGPRPSSRNGLAPLELVLSLPILMFVMALMLVFGTAGAWKVRTMANSREAAFRAIDPRTGNRDAHPLGWPKEAEMSLDAGRPTLMPVDPFAGHQVVRGPVLADPSSGQHLPVNTDLLDVSVGVLHGHSRIVRDLPLLSKMPPHEIDFSRETVIVDGTLWRYQSMGFGSNVTRRILNLYDFQLQARQPDLCFAFVEKAVALLTNPKREEMTPIEGGDPEMRFLLNEESPNFRRAPRGFTLDVDFCQTFPRPGDPCFDAALALLVPDPPTGTVWAPRYCQTDRHLVLRDKVQGHKWDIEHQIPRRLANYYRGRYETVKRRIENGTQPPDRTVPIGELEEKIEQIDAFIGSLPTPPPPRP